MAPGEIKFRAYIVPALGKPFVQGDLGWVMSSVMGLLRTHPGYTIAVRSVMSGKSESTHSILVSTSVTGGVRVQERPANGCPGDPRRMAVDLAEVRTVLTNLGHRIHQPEEF